MKSKRRYTDNSIPAIIALGLKHLKCKGYGICEVKIVKSLDNIAFPLEGNKVAASLQINGGYIKTIFFLKSSMNKFVQKKYFYNNVFVVEDDFYFRCSKVSNKAIKIAKGKYPIRQQENQFVLPLMQQISV